MSTEEAKPLPGVRDVMQLYGQLPPTITTASNTTPFPLPLPSFEQQAALVYSDGFCPDGGYIDGAIVDQWWRITVACDHGEWHGVSNGPIDLGRGLERAIQQARAAHTQETTE
jgi:hypothetical protein